MNKISKIIYLTLIIVLLGGCSAINKTNNENNLEVSYDEYIKVTRVLPHNQTSFTEGLFFYNNQLYESSGLYGKSKFYSNIDLETGLPEKNITIDSKLFAEGATILNKKIYILTYKENKVLVYDLDTNQLMTTYDYPNEGWGLTTDGKHLILSDGSNKIYYLDENMNTIKTLNITLNEKPIDNINELEYINGYIWANIWKSNYIIIIDSSTGKVIRKIDFTNLINKYLKDYPNVDSLNGIAYNDNKLYFTGKYYPYLFECKIDQKIYD